MAWAKFPTAAIRNRVLSEDKLRWVNSKGNVTAALLVWIVLVIRHNEVQRIKKVEREWVEITYDEFEMRLDISRSKISAGLKILLSLGVIMKEPERSRYKIYGFHGDTRFSALPESYILNNSILKKFKLRNRVESDALKIYLLLLDFMNGITGISKIGFDKMVEYTGVLKDRISNALSLLFELGLVILTITEDAEGSEKRGRVYKIRGELVRPNNS
jgi:DNA-binding transcriptional ArsR family regulator